jgi:tetratricopeptide (TPR) repeat protein
MSEPEPKNTQPDGIIGDPQPENSSNKDAPSDFPAAGDGINGNSQMDPVAILDDPQPNSIKPVKPPRPVGKKLPRWLVAVSVLILITLGLLGGFNSGLGQRYAAQDTQVAGQLVEQFKLGQQAFDAGNYELARQYFEFILTTDSNYPGIQAAYTDMLLRMQVTPTPVFSPTPVISPTPDLRGAEEIFNTALQLLNSSDWSGAITNLDSIRKLNPTYRTAEVDGMYYMALRQRGVEKIVSGCQNVNLEGGIYDLTLAEHFVGSGNLDAYADGLRTYARLYIIGASFWDQDWLQAQNFFAQVKDAFPNLSDSSCKSATRRWLEASYKIADQQLLYGNPCFAKQTYEYLFSGGNDPYNATVYPTATAAAIKCYGGVIGSDAGNGGNGLGNTPIIAETPTHSPPIYPTDTPIEIPATEIPTDTPVPVDTPICDPSSGTPCP